MADKDSDKSSEEDDRGWTDSDGSEEREAKDRANQEFEIKEHQAMIARRQKIDDDKAVAKTPFRSSKGFLAMKDKRGDEDVLKSSLKKYEDEGEKCPYKTCGRTFISIPQLQAHILRRHKDDKVPKKKEEVKKAPSTKLGGAKKQNAGVAAPKEEAKGTPVPSKNKAPTSEDADMKLFEKPKDVQFFNARPRARPMTSWGGGGANAANQAPTSKDQQELLKDIMHGSAKQIAMRPQTAATSTLRDETRIVNKLKYLEKIEQKIEDDLDDFINKRGDKYKAPKTGLPITKKIILEASNADTLDQVTTVILRDKSIEVFDQPYPGTDGYFKFDQLVNLECIYASHNLIKDIFGICQLVTLRELNLSFNMIKDISPIEELTLLEKLFLNRNQIAVIEPIKKLTSLSVVGLFHNEIFNSQKTLEVLAFLGINYKLREISIDGNPISSTTRFKNQLLVSIPKLKTLDEDRIEELDREVAKQYFELNNIPKPDFGAKPANVKKEDGPGFEAFVAQGKQNLENPDGKKVKFKQIDDDHEGDWQTSEIKKLSQRVSELVVENSDLKKKLEKKKYDQVYKENQLLQLELKNMYILEQENKDLKEDYDRLKALSYDEKIKRMAQENADLRKRNGMLLIQADEYQEKLKAATQNQLSSAPSQAQVLEDAARPKFARPQTAAARTKDALLDDADLALAQTAFDRELNELLAKNQATLQGLHNDMKQVGRITGDISTVNVRKINNTNAVRKVLKQSNQENQIDSSTMKSSLKSSLKTSKMNETE